MANEQKMSNVPRRFVDIPETAVSMLDSTWESSAHYFGTTYSWPQVLETPRVLLISEAGTGKTHECKRMQAELWNEGKAAFYVELSSLSGSELATSLGGSPQVARFEEWKDDPTRMATFFLDSVDELRLTQTSFRSALEAVSRGIGNRTDRVRLVVTSRPTDFDRAELLRQFPVRDNKAEEPEFDPAERFVQIATGHGHQEDKPSKPDAPKICHVKLSPLTPADIRVFSADLGVTNPDRFVEALLARDELDFAGRPMDLIELVATWMEFGELRSHREQVEANISARLKPRSDRERELSHQKALDGAQTLALAALLMRKLTIRYGDDSDSGDAPHSVINPVDVLPTWPQAEHQALLERGLFGHAGYGRVRFHHRSVFEFLAAEKLNAMLNAGTPIRDVFDVLFVDTTEGILAIRPSMRPTAAWLAARLPLVFREMVRRQPEALLLHGDPASLSVNDRLAAFRAYADRIQALNSEGTSFPMEQVRRFASVELTNDAVTRMRSGVVSPDLRRLCIRIMAVHPTTDACILADDLVRDPAGETLERCYAAEVLIAAGGPQVPALAHDLAFTRAWADEDALAISSRLLPAHMSVQEICALLARVKPTKSDATNIVTWNLATHVTSGQAPREYVEELQRLLTDTILDGMAWHSDWPHLRTTRGDLLTLLGAACSNLFETSRATVEALAAAVIIPAVAESADRYESPVGVVRELARSWSGSLRAVAFIATDALHQGFHPETEPFKRMWASHQGLIEFDDTRDAEWLLDAVGNHALPIDTRAMALEASLRGVQPRNVTVASHLKHLINLVSDQPGLVTRVENARRAGQVTAEDKKRALEARQQTEERARQKRANENAWRRFRKHVKANPGSAFSPKRVRSTVLNLWRAMRRAPGSALNANWNRTFVEATFDKDAADRLRAAMMSLWREFKPSLPSEREGVEKNRTYETWHLGLSGIAAEAEDSSWARRLTKEDALLAARYIPVEMNHFPAWIDDLAKSHPESLIKALSVDLDEELAMMFEATSSTLLLQNVRDTTETTRQLFMPNIEQWLEKNASKLAKKRPHGPPNHSVNLTCDLIFAWGTEHARVLLQKTAEQSLRRGCGKEWALQWLTTLFKLNRASALDILEARLGNTAPATKTDALWLIPELFGDRSMHAQLSLAQGNLEPDQLARLTRLAFAHIRTQDDAYKTGTFSPDARDRAQFARSRIIGALFETDGPGSWEAKVSIAAEPAVASYKDRVLALARERAAGVADGTALDPMQVRALLQSAAVPPKTRDQMYALMRHRMDDIEESLREETSSREAMAVLASEKLMRRHVAGLLKNVARGAYTVVQESVTAEEKEMDFRLISTASAESGVIELKVGDERPGRDLRDTIQNQLVTLYLGSSTQKAGCLLVTVATDANWQHPDSKDLLDINGLRLMLSDEAARVERVYDGQIRLFVKVLDLRQPPGTEPRAKTRIASKITRAKAV